jgi:hypothetical protein
MPKIDPAFADAFGAADRGQKRWKPGPISILEDPDEDRRKRVNELMNSADLGNALYKLLEGHEKRVAGLIRYNSEQVILRRVINAKLKHLLVVVGPAARVFRTYAQHHRNKVNSRTPKGQITETMERARINDLQADILEAAMIFEPNPEDYGRS